LRGALSGLLEKGEAIIAALFFGPALMREVFAVCLAGISVKMFFG
jgi:hypothetical protein